VSHTKRYRPKPANRTVRASRSRYLHLSNVMDTNEHASLHPDRGGLKECGVGLVTGIRSLKTPGPGAVAHMSLHHQQQFQRAARQKRRTLKPPRFSYRGTVCPSMLATEAAKPARNRLYRVGGVASMSRRRFGQHPFFRNMTFPCKPAEVLPLRLGKALGRIGSRQ